MGGNPWHYFTPYRVDLNSALQALREQEFRAGRYGYSYWANRWIPDLLTGNFAETFALLEDTIEQPKPANELIEEYGSIEAAIEVVLEQFGEGGTHSILDIMRLSEEPEMDAICTISESELQQIFGTTQPTRDRVEAILVKEEEPESWQMFWDDIGRGEGRYIIIYQGGQPSELFFAGYSFD